MTYMPSCLATLIVDAAAQDILNLIISHSPEVIWGNPEAGRIIEALPWEEDGKVDGYYWIRYKENAMNPLEGNKLIGDLEDCAIAAHSHRFSFSSPYGPGTLQIDCYPVEEPRNASWDKENYDTIAHCSWFWMGDGLTTADIAKAIMAGEVEWDKPKEWCDPQLENLNDVHWSVDPDDPDLLLGINYNTWDFPIQKGDEARGMLRGERLSLWCDWIEEEH